MRSHSVGQNDDLYLAAVGIILSSGDEADVLDLHLVDKPQYDTIVQYRNECCSAATNAASPPHGHYKWMPDPYADYSWHSWDNSAEHDDGQSCQLGGSYYIGSVSGKSTTRRWWKDFVDDVGRQLQRRPCGTTVREEGPFDRAMTRASGCRICSRDLNDKFPSFVHLF